MMSRFTFRDLATVDEFAAVVDLERAIWGPDYRDVVPVPMFVVSAKRGGILIGAFDEGRLIGFVYSLPGVRDGRPTQWSHMLGIAPEHRQMGLGRHLKLLQRDRALALGVDLIEWTFDPMQAANAHLNFARLGAIVREYGVNVYGDSTSVLHRGSPTDRFVAEWWIRTPEVERRVSSSPQAPERAGEGGAVPVNELRLAGPWAECGRIDLVSDARRLQVEIPTGFTEMLRQAPERAMAWRLATRQIFRTYFARGYSAVDFLLDRRNNRGAYLLSCD